MKRIESSGLTEEQRHRYQRQLVIPDIGADGQARLGRARVLIIGLGGLGSITSYYLAAAGVGWLRIVDHDIVVLSNLNRQLLHWTKDLGRPKSVSAGDKLRHLNPDCFIEPMHVPVAEDSGYDLADGCDVIIDATDNLATRHALNRISLGKRIPFVYGGINGWNGTVATFIPGKTCCLACLFPKTEGQDEERITPALGPTAGVIASIQSMEVLRILLGLEPGLAGRLLEFQGSRMRFRTVRLERNPDCLLCGGSRGG